MEIYKIFMRRKHRVFINFTIFGLLSAPGKIILHGLARFVHFILCYFCKCSLSPLVDSLSLFLAHLGRLDRKRIVSVVSLDGAAYSIGTHLKLSLPRVDFSFLRFPH